MAGLLDFLLNDPTASGGGWLMQLLDPQGAAKAGTRTPLTSGPPGTAMGLGAPATNPPGMAQPLAGGLGGAMGLPSSGLLGDSPLGKLLRGAAYGLAAGQGQRGFGAGFGAGLSGAAQMADQRQQSQMRNMLFQRQNQAWQQQQAQAQAQQDAYAKLFGGPIAAGAPQLASTDPNASASQPDPLAGMPAGLRQLAQTQAAAGDYAGATKIAETWLEQQNKPDALPNSVQEYQYAQKQGFKGSYDDWLTADANRRAARTLVSVNASPENSFNKGLGDLQSATIGKWQADATAALKSNQAIDRLQSTLNDGLKTGFGTEAVAKLGNVVESTGLASADDVNRIFGTAGTAEFQATKNKLVIDMLGGLGRQISDTDREYMDKTLGTISDPTDAVRSILAYVKSRNQLDIQKYQQGYYDVKHKGADPIEWDTAWAQKYGITSGPPAAPASAPAASSQSSGGFKEGDIALNKQTGQKIIFKGGQWVPLQ